MSARPDVLVGFMGAGKTTVGTELAALKGVDFIDVDREIERRTSRSIPDLFAEGEEAFRELEESVTVEVVRTTRPLEAAELARKGVDDGFDAIIVLGGDGTANEVLNGIGAEVPIGLLPGGGTSVMARNLGLPPSIPAAARRLAVALREGTERHVRVGRLNGRRFAFNAGVHTRLSPMENSVIPATTGTPFLLNVPVLTSSTRKLYKTLVAGFIQIVVRLISTRFHVIGQPFSTMFVVLPVSMWCFFKHIQFPWIIRINILQ